MIAAGRPLRDGFAAPIGCAALAFLAFVALGTWQLERRVEKVALIGTLHQRLSAAPTALPARPLWPQLNRSADEYRRVRFSAAFVPGADALVYAGPSPFPGDLPGAGYWLFALARGASGDRIVLNRGYMPEEEKNRARPKSSDEGSGRASGEPSNELEMLGVMRWPQAGSWFTPADDATHDLWFARDHLAIARAKEWGEVAPFYVELEAPLPSGGLPRPAPLYPNLRNEHLQYAITWYGLAVVVLVMGGFWLKSQHRR